MQDGGLNKAWAELDERMTELGEAILAELRKSLQAYQGWRARRALRTPSNRLEWSPDPAGLQKLRQAWCAVWRHNFQLQYDAIEDDFDREHPGVTRSCLRCGITYGWCLLHSGAHAEGGEEE